MKNLRVWLVPFLIVASLVFSLLHQSNYLTCQVNYRQDKNLIVNGSAIQTEVVSSPADLAKGLGGRACIGADEGMLFVFLRPGYYPFWMKDMKFPIDMVWINTNHQAVHIAPDVTPSTYPQSFVNTQLAQYVLELKAGAANKLGITYGSTINF